MSTVLRRYYSMYILHACMRESEKQDKNKKNERKVNNELTRRAYSLNDNFNKYT